MSDKAICPVCSEGKLVLKHVDTLTEYHGQKETVRLAFSECDNCGSEIAGSEETRANKHAMMHFRKKVDGLLSGEEIRAIRGQYRLTQAQAAKLFGGGPVAFSKYENDDVSHSEAMDTLLRLVRLSEDAYKNLVAMKGIRFGFRRRTAKYAYRWDMDNVTFVDFDKAG